MGNSRFSREGELYPSRRHHAVPTETVGHLHRFPSGNRPAHSQADILSFFTVSVGYLQLYGECRTEHRSAIAPPSTRDDFSQQNPVLIGLPTYGTATESQSPRRHTSARPAGHVSLRSGCRSRRGSAWRDFSLTRPSAALPVPWIVWRSRGCWFRTR